MSNAVYLVRDLLEETTIQGAMDALCDGEYLEKAGFEDNDQDLIEDAFSILQEMQRTRTPN